MSDKFRTMGFEVRRADNWDTFKTELANAKKFGENQDQDNLLIYYAGHGDIYLPSGNRDKFNKAIRSGKNEPELEGLLHFQNPAKTDHGLNNSHIVHEKDFMGRIADAGKSFDQVTVIIDACHAGVFDNKQFTNPSAADLATEKQINYGRESWLADQMNR